MWLLHIDTIIIVIIIVIVTVIIIIIIIIINGDTNQGHQIKNM